MSKKTLAEKLPKPGDRRIMEALDTAHWVQEYVLKETVRDPVNGKDVQFGTWTNLYGPYSNLETARLAAKRGILKRVVEMVDVSSEKV